jgi:hypothetical protein
LYGDILEHYWSEIFWCYDQRLITVTVCKICMTL